MKHALKLGLSALCLLLTGLLFGQNEESADWVRTHYNKQEVMIPMRDGIRLFTAIYTPKDTSKTYPILMKRTPYSSGPYGADQFPAQFQNKYLAKEGYIFVNQDVRGRYMSEGEFVDVRPYQPTSTTEPVKKGGKAKKEQPAIDEATDTYDTVDWLLEHLSNDNGNVGVYGISYPGFYSTMAILAKHPAIKAVSPQAPVTDWFIGDDFHHNGAFMLMDAFSFYSGFGKPRPKPTTQGQPGFQDWKTPDNYEFYLRTGALRNFNEQYLKGGIPFWNDLVAHPNYDEWWQARNPRPHLKEVQAAVLTVGGLFDAEDCFGAWQVYKAIERQNSAKVSNRLIMGPWVHGGWARGKGDRLGNVHFGVETSDYYAREMEFPFFEYYLKGKGQVTLDDVTVFETGSNQWTQYPAWPPAQAKETAYYLRENHQISLQKPDKTTEAFHEYLSDPAHPVPYTEDVHLRRTREYMTDDQRFASRRPDVLTYSTPVLEKPITATGPIIADLWVSTSGTDADWVVKVIDVFPDTLSAVENGVPMGGYQMLVRGEVMRGRFRNSFEEPEPFVPGEAARVRFELPDIAHTFLPGHRMMIQIQSSWFPLVDRNPQQFVNIYECSDADFIRAEHRVYHSAQHPSAIRFYTLEKGETQAPR
jgi:putative CocE/NonD family hydrolase